MSKYRFTKEWYLENAKKPGVVEGTEKGKKTVADFVKALDIRMRARDDELTSQYFEDLIIKYAQTAMMFFKYLTQTPEFDKMNDPSSTVPIITAWRRPDGLTQMVSNHFGSHEEGMLKSFPMIQELYFKILHIVRYTKISEVEDNTAKWIYKSIKAQLKANEGGEAKKKKAKKP